MPRFTSGLALATLLALAGCKSAGTDPELPDADLAFDASFDIEVPEATVDAADAGDASDADAGDASDADADAADASDADAGDADAGDADAGDADASDAPIEAEAGVAHALASQGLVGAGGVARSNAYQLAWTLGQSTPNTSAASSSKYRLRGGVVGANGSPP